MRLIPALTFCLAASPAMAQSVEVSVGAELADKTEEYGQRDVDRLVTSLDEAAEDALAQSGRYPGARLYLVLEDATPNRPTFQQLTDRPGLSMDSIGVGGAEISGRLVTADGAEIPVSYRWFETNLAFASAAHTWSDTERAFRRFAGRLAEGRY